MKKMISDDSEIIDNNNNIYDNTKIVDILATIFHYRKWFIVSIITCMLIGVLYLYSTPNKYSQSATILVKESKNGKINSEAAAFQDIFSLGSNSVDNEMGFFKSKRLMMEVTKLLNLNISYKKRKGLYKTELYTAAPFKVTFLDNEIEDEVNFIATMPDKRHIEISEITVKDLKYDTTIKLGVGDTTDTPMGKIVITPTLSQCNNYIGKPIEVKKCNPKNISDSYNNKLKVTLSNKQSSLINLEIEDENINRAKDVLNTLIKVYEKDAIDDKNKIVVNTTNFIKTRLAIIESDLGIVDSEIELYKKKNRLTDISSESALFLQNTGRLDSEGLSVENQLNMAEYMKRYLSDLSKTTDLIPASIGVNNNGIQNQINEYNSIVTKRNKLVTNSSTNNPIVQDMNETLASLRISILKAVDNLITGLKIQVSNMKNKERENLSKISNVPTQQKHVISIERQQKIKEELYLYLLNKKEESELQLHIAESNCRIVDSADGSTLPIYPKRANVLLISFMMGIAIPASLLYLYSILNTSIRTKEELKANLTIPFLCEIPFEKQKHDKDIVVKDGGKDRICESFKILRENIDYITIEKGKVIQLTSFNQNSGKTFTCINLAISISLSNAKVIVLDLDLRKGSLTKKSNIGTKQAGITNYLTGKIDEIKDLINPYYEGCKWHIITSGPLPPNPAELLKSGKLDNLINELKKEYDYILIDNPPYGIVVDTSLCSRLADQTIYIIRSGLFDKRQLPDLQELYDSNKIRNMSIVLNATTHIKNGYGYEYKYGYDEDVEFNTKSFFRKIMGI